MLYLIIAAVAWLPVQVAFAASFIMPVSTPVEMSAGMTTNPSHGMVMTKSAGQVNAGMTMAHCDMHKNVKQCCQSDTACNMSDQECSKCLTFVAMSYYYQQPHFVIQYQTQYHLPQPLIGTTHLTDLRPPRTTVL